MNIINKFKGQIPPKLDSIVEFQTSGMNPPNKVIFGFKAIEKIGDEAKKLTQGKLAVIVSDQNLQKLGIISNIESFLLQYNFQVEIFAEVEAEPSLQTCINLYKKFEKRKVDIFIGVGGGSVMDVTKLVSQSLGQQKSPNKYVNGDETPNKKAIPMMLIPTTAGTGSEVSDIVVLVLDNGSKKFLKSAYYLPDIIIIDPLLSASMPKSLTAITGIDALSHAIEGMMHKNSNPFTHAFGIEAISLISKHIRSAVADGENLEARYYMSIAATFGAMAMCASGTALYAHSASFIIAKYKHTPHGLGCAIGLPYSMNYNLPVIPDRLAQIASAMGEQSFMLSEWDKAKWKW